jgi:hypothetical protein
LSNIEFTQTAPPPQKNRLPTFNSFHIVLVAVLRTHKKRNKHIVNRMLDYVHDVELSTPFTLVAGQIPYVQNILMHGNQISIRRESHLAVQKRVFSNKK